MSHTSEQIKTMTGTQIADLLKNGGTTPETLADTLRRAIQLLDTGYWPQPVSPDVEAAMYRAQKNGDVVLRHLGGHVTFLNSGAVMIDRTNDPEPYVQYEQRLRQSFMKQKAQKLHTAMLSLQSWPSPKIGVLEPSGWFTGWQRGFEAAQNQFAELIHKELK